MSQSNKACRLIAILIIVVVAMTTGSCSTSQSSGRNSAVDETGVGWKRDTTPIKLDWYINYSWFTAKWGDNAVSKYITKKTGVSLNFIAPKGDENEKLSALIDSGELPDFITLTCWDDGYLNIINNNLVLPLDELADKYDMYFTKVADKQKLEWYRQANGHVYCYPNYSEPLKNTDKYREEQSSNQSFLVRKDIYEAIGKPDMRTPEGFLKALKMAKSMYPEVDGEPLIPLGLHEFNNSGNLSLDSILVNLLAIPMEKGGRLYDKITDKEYVRWLKTLRKANEMGLLSKEIFVDRRPQMDEKIAQGRYFAMLYQRSDIVSQQTNLYSKDKNQIYIPVDGPSNSKLTKPALPGDSISGWTVTMISKSCRNPKRAIRFLSYLISEEGNRDLYLGEKGSTWDVIDGKEAFKPNVAEMLNNNRAEFDKKYGAAETYWMLMDKHYIFKWRPDLPEYLKVLEEWGKGKTYNFSVYDHIFPYGDSEEGINRAKITLRWQDTLKSLLIAKNDKEFDKILKEFLMYREGQGNQQILKYMQKRIEENKKILGIKN